MHRSTDGGCPVLRYLRDVSKAEWRPGAEEVLANVIYSLDDVRAGLTGDRADHRRLAVLEPVISDVFDRLDNVADIGHPHGRAVLIGDKQRCVLRSVEQLIGRVDLPPSARRYERHPSPGEHWRFCSAAATSVIPMPMLFMTVGFTWTRTAGLELPHMWTCPTPSICAIFCARIGVRDVVHVRTVVDVRTHAEHENRLVGRVDLPIPRIAGQIGWKLPASRVDGRLHVTPGGIDVTIQIELQRDLGAAELAGRSHLRYAGNASELALERRCDRRCHRLRTCSGQIGVDLNRREIHFRQRRHRKQGKRGCPP